MEEASPLASLDDNIFPPTKDRSKRHRHPPFTLPTQASLPSPPLPSPSLSSSLGSSLAQRKAQAHTEKEHGRKRNLSLTAIKQQAPLVFCRLQPLLYMWRSSMLSDAEMVWCYILVHLQIRYPHSWFCGLRTELAGGSCCILKEEDSKICRGQEKQENLKKEEQGHFNYKGTGTTVPEIPAVIKTNLPSSFDAPISISSLNLPTTFPLAFSTIFDAKSSNMDRNQSTPVSPSPCRASILLTSLPTDSLYFTPAMLAAISSHGTPTLLTLTHCRLRRLSLPALDAMREWLLGHWPLRLYLDIPSPQHVLDMQCRGERVVSMLIEEHQLSTLHFGHDAMDFSVHDLTHAHRMYGLGDEHLRAQIGALRLLQRSLRAGCLRDYLDHDEEFKAAFDYGISDMNTHCLHTLQYIKHNIMAAFMRRCGLDPFEQMCSELESNFYGFFFDIFVDSWRLGDKLTDDVRIALLSLCERPLNTSILQPLVTLCLQMAAEEPIDIHHEL